MRAGWLSGVVAITQARVHTRACVGVFDRDTHRFSTMFSSLRLGLLSNDNFKLDAAQLNLVPIFDHVKQV